MKEELVKFETAKLAKKKGFDIKCEHFYTKPNSRMFGLDEHGRSYSISNSTKNKIYTIGLEATLNEKNVIFAPTQSLLQKWLREKYNIQLRIHFKHGYPNKHICSYLIGEAGNKYQVLSRRNTYEQALEKGLQEALNLIK